MGFLPGLFLPCCRWQGVTAQCRRRSRYRCGVRGRIPDRVLPFRSRSTTYASRRFDASRSMVRLGRDSKGRIHVWRVERFLCRPQYWVSEDYTNDWHQLRSMAGIQASAGVIEGRMYTYINMVSLPLNVLREEFSEGTVRLINMNGLPTQRDRNELLIRTESASWYDDCFLSYYTDCTTRTTGTRRWSTQPKFG